MSKKVKVLPYKTYLNTLLVIFIIAAFVSLGFNLTNAWQMAGKVFGYLLAIIFLLITYRSYSTKEKLKIDYQKHGWLIVLHMIFALSIIPLFIVSTFNFLGIGILLILMTFISLITSLVHIHKVYGLSLYFLIPSLILYGILVGMGVYLKSGFLLLVSVVLTVVLWIFWLFVMFKYVLPAFYEYYPKLLLKKK